MAVKRLRSPSSSSPAAQHKALFHCTDGDVLTCECATAVRSFKHEDRARSLAWSDDMTYLLVADGHGGPSVAERAADQLLPEIARLANNETMEAVMRDSFLRFHRAAQQDKDSAGTTCTVVAINQRTRLITCANVGDSQAYLVLSESIVPLGIDHRLECNAEERERVVADGGVVARALAPTGERRAVGPLRGWPGGLAMGRSLGDRDCGEWLSPEPSITRTSMPAEGGRVVVCSDGVWDAVSMQAVARLVREGGSPAATAEKVVAKAIRAPVPARLPHARCHMDMGSLKSPSRRPQAREACVTTRPVRLQHCAALAASRRLRARARPND